MTKSVNATITEHRLTAAGLIDRDRRPESHVKKLQNYNIYTLDVQSIENLYYFPTVIAAVCDQLSAVELLNAAEVKFRINETIISSLKDSSDFLASDAAERSVRIATLSNLPYAKDFVSGKFKSTGISANGIKHIYEKEKILIKSLIESGNVDSIMRNYSIKKTKVPKSVRTLLKISDDSAYSALVRRLAVNNDEFSALLKGLIGPFGSALTAQLVPASDQVTCSN